jgi:hypothetical protein
VIGLFQAAILAFNSLAVACALTVSVLEIFACSLKGEPEKEKIVCPVLVRERQHKRTDWSFLNVL